MLNIDNDFVKKHTPLIYLILKEKGGRYSREVIEEIVYHTWVNALRNAKYYDDTFSETTFMRVQVLHAKHEVIEGTVSSTDALPQKVTSDIPEVSDEELCLSVQEMRNTLNKYMHLLDILEREVFTARVYDREPVASVAERLTMHKNSVNRVLKRAIRKLTHIVAEGDKIPDGRKSSKGVTLGFAVKQYDDKHYFPFLLHCMKGLSLVEVGKRNGRSVQENLELIHEMKRMIKQDWGFSL